MKLNQHCLHVEFVEQRYKSYFKLISWSLLIFYLFVFGGLSVLLYCIHAHTCTHLPFKLRNQDLNWMQRSVLHCYTQAHSCPAAIFNSWSSYEDPKQRDHDPVCVTQRRAPLNDHWCLWESYYMFIFRRIVCWLCSSNTEPIPLLLSVEA